MRHADFIVRWKPFWFDADIGIVIGASYTIDWGFTTSTISVELGCDLQLWGPPTGGSATLDFYVISITIPFGTPKNNTQSVTGWTDVEKMLPNTGSVGQPRNVLTLSPAAGSHPRRHGADQEGPGGVAGRWRRRRPTEHPPGSSAARCSPSPRLVDSR